MRRSEATPVLFVVHVKVGSTGTVPFEVRIGDDIPTMVEYFCRLYRLGERQRVTLLSFIENKLLHANTIAVDIDKALATPKEMDNSTDRQLLEEMGKDTDLLEVQPSVVIIKDELKKTRLSNPQEVPRFEQLYRLSKVLRDRSAERIRQAEKSFSFMPDISQSVSASQYYSRPMSLSFHDRMNEDIKLRAERSRNRDSMRDSIKTSSVHQRPSTKSKGENVSQSRCPVAVTQGLYELAAAKVERQNFLRKQVDKHFEVVRSARKINDASLGMVEALEKQKIEELFATLDHDHDGLICAQRIGIDNISNARLTLICPLLEEMQSKQVVLDIGSFSRAVGRLLGRLSINQRRILLGLEKEKQHDCGANNLPSFQPRICPNTNRILHRGKSPTERRSLSEEKYKRMLQEIEAKKKEEESECRFRPNFMNKNYKVTASAYSSAH